MDRYVISFTLESDEIQIPYIVSCNNQIEVAGIIARAEGAGYKLLSATKLPNAYELEEFLDLLDSKDNGNDLLFGDKK